MNQVIVLGISAGITLAIQLTGFLVAYAFQTEVFYDILGGLNYLALAIFSAVVGDSSVDPWSSDSRKIACVSIFAASRSWLLIFLAWRAYDRGGDSRFDEVKSKFFEFSAFWIGQAFWVVLISMPMIFVNSSSVDKPNFSAVDWISIILFGLAVLLAIVADIQKAAWVKRGRKGTFCRDGVWAYSRHPNYFGEILQWWACWVFAFSSGEGFSDVQWWFSILSPLFTMNILLNTKATGIPQANGASLKRYYDKCPEEYAEYRASTSILIPMIGYKNVPMFLKRTLFLDLERWEYRPTEGIVETVTGEDKIGR